MQHISSDTLSPVLVAMSPLTASVLLAVPVREDLAVLAHPVGVQPHVVVHAIAEIELVDFPVKPIYFINMIDITWVWDWPIVSKPGKF